VDGALHGVEWSERDAFGPFDGDVADVLEDVRLVRERSVRSPGHGVPLEAWVGVVERDDDRRFEVTGGGSVGVDIGDELVAVDDDDLRALVAGDDVDVGGVRSK
jgi:hypothetical protein